ncbi:MAG TPA: DedA family protein [Dehalococcoidia bacterium]|nr:DedA family protein [Dehalococcoidia bacterium]
MAGESEPAEPTHSRAAANRVLAGVLGVSLTTVIGSAGVLAVYYPLRHSAYEVQWLLVFVLMLFESAAVHLPSEVILPAGGWLIVREHELGVAGVLGLSMVAALGNTAGSGLLYTAGRFGGRPLVRHFGRYFLLHESDLDRAEHWFVQRHTWAVLLTRVVPVIRTYSGFAAGALRLPIMPFFVLTFAGSFAWCLPFVALGALLGSQWDVIEGPAKIVGIAVLAAILTFVLWFSLRSPRQAG